MPSATPTTEEEEDFMKGLLSDHETFFNKLPSSFDPYSKTATRYTTATDASRAQNTSIQATQAHPTSPLENTKRTPFGPLGLNIHAGKPTQYDNTDAKDITLNSAVVFGDDHTGLDASNTLSKQPRPTDGADLPSSPVKGRLHQRISPIIDVDIAALLEGAEDWDMSDELDVTDSPSHLKIPLPPPLVREPCTRCVVEQISSPDALEKRLIVKVDDRTGTQKREVILKQDWVYTQIIVGDTINVLGEFTPLAPATNSTDTLASTITLTSRVNMLILQPDLLLSATTIANAPSCPRKPLLSALLSSNAPSPPSFPAEFEVYRHKIIDDQGAAMTWGNYLHGVMQRCLEIGRWDMQWIEKCIDEVVRSPESFGNLVKLGVSIDAAMLEIKARAGGLEEFAKRFVGSSVKPEAQLTDLHDMGDLTSCLALTKLYGVEEDIWSPTYGLKGKLDATVQVLVEQKKVMTGKLSSTKPGQIDTRCWTMPFEIKTGRAVGVLEHRAQTMLYNLLVAERYGVEVPSGLLYYTHSKDLMRVSTVRMELKGLIMARNELVSYMMRKRCATAAKAVNPGGQAILPATIDDDFKCARCYVVDGCMLYRKAVEGITDDSSSIATLYAGKTSHLTQTQCDFYKKWEALISLEEQDVIRFRKELWTLTAEERETTGRCFARMVVLDYKNDITPGIARTHQYVYRLIRADSSGSMSATLLSPYGAKPSLLNGNITVGDAVTVSIEPDLFALARGFVMELEPYHVVVGFDHEIDLKGILKRSRSLDTALSKIICRIDKDEFGGGMSRIRNNLARLFYVNGDKKRLSLVVDLAPPTFDEGLAPGQSELPADLNLNQQQAVSKVLSAKDYAIVLGMPGTGKTTTIAEIINVLVKRGKTVLLAAYTHSAVDNILLKLNDADYPILRLGSLDKVHPDIHKHALAHQTQSTTIEQFEEQILRPPVVATTCLSVDHSLFARRYFDFCIIDEAAQVTLPTCLGPLRYADKFVLVGDHFQLPPLVRSRAARAGGLDVSLFRRLVDAHPEAVVELAYQYRMNDDIMLLANKLIYSERLLCGSNSIARRTLVLPQKTTLNGSHVDSCRNGACWMEKLLDENCKAVFVDTDMVPGEESCVGSLIQNEVEAKLVYHVTESLLKSGITQSQIGIISLYRQQIKLLSHFLHRRKEIELLTADKSQGRDKDCIIISMVRSNISSETGDLLKDWRRINVSFTRARSKLIIFGSRKTLCTVPVLQEFFHLMEEKGWILSLPPGADSVHAPPSEVHTTPSKRGTADDYEDKENCNSSVPRKTKKTRLDQGVLKGRPMLQDVVNDVM